MTHETMSLTDLEARLDGRVLRPGEEAYEAARGVLAGDVDSSPALIVRPTTDAQVAAALAVARESGLPLAVRSGGHSAAGHGTVDGGLVVDLRDMTAVDVDIAGRTVWAEAGLTAAELTQATAQHGLVVGFGDTGSVGIGGITLGGGVGYLSRAFGLTVDNLLAADVVTADGRVLRVDETSHPELFWAIRGGGGNFGVVTRFQYRLHELDGVVGGMLVLPATPDTMAGFIAAATAASDRLTTIANVMNCPPLPFVDEAHHGSLVIMALVCWAGDAATGEEALRPLRELAEPLADMLRPIPYPEMFPPEDPDYRPTAVAKTMFVDTLGRDEAARVIEHLAASDASVRVAQLRVLGGAVARVPAEATAYAHRSSRIMVNVAAFYDGADDRPRRARWVDGLVAELHQGDDGAYVNFLADEGPERVRAAYPGTTWDRLAAVKATYDPGNLFQRNQNVPPGG